MAWDNLRSLGKPVTVDQWKGDKYLRNNDPLNWIYSSLVPIKAYQLVPSPGPTSSEVYSVSRKYAVNTYQRAWRASSRFPGRTT